ncbi:hypothetical protein [Nordella sp. HKS 07]|uniref:hypothetical protein n=1 Tax=Nordella sp. HKS 07 TaxID=2712222 RepID=UPI00352D1E2A
MTVIDTSPDTTIGMEGDRSGRAKLAMVGLGLLLAAACVISIMTGPVPLSATTVLQVIFTPDAVSLRDQAIVWSVRLPTHPARHPGRRRARFFGRPAARPVPQSARRSGHHRRLGGCELRRHYRYRSR